MSYWSPEPGGKRVLRSRDLMRMPAGESEEQNMPVTRRETRAMSKKGVDQPVERNPQEMPVARNPHEEESPPVPRNPTEEGYDVPVSRNVDVATIVEVVDPLQMDAELVPGNADASSQSPASVSAGSGVQFIRTSPIGTEEEVEKVKVVAAVVPQPQLSQSRLESDTSGPTDNENLHQMTTNSTLDGNEDYEPATRPTRSGTPVPMEFISFGNVNIKAAEDEVMYRENNDIPHLARRRAPRKAPYSLGEPYPIPQLRPRYWKPGAAAEVSGESRGQKRKYGRQGQGGKMPKTAPTSATCVLNERYPGLVYEFDDPVGPPHALTFTVSIDFQPLGGRISAAGSSKKSAKNNLAESILNQLGFEVPQKMVQADPSIAEILAPLIAHQEFGEATPPPGCVPPLFMPSQFMNPPLAEPQYQEVDFASDDVLEVCQAPAPAMIQPIQQPFVHPNVIHRLRNIPNLEENAVNALNSILLPQVTEYKFVSEEGQPHDKTFTTELQFIDYNQVQQFYVGKGGSKKKSKANAAVQALITMLSPEVFVSLAQRSLLIGKAGRHGQQIVDTAPLEDASMELEQEHIDMENNEPYADQYNTAFMNHVRGIVMEKYDEIMTEEKDYLSQKVLAGVVMTWAVPFLENSAVIAVTTGTKCIEGDFMSTGGLALNDCHAEVLATRCLRDYLFSQLDELRSGEITDEHCIFERLSEENEIEKYRLKDGVLFHLYISTSPCGDARIFSPKGLECEDDELEPPGEEIVDTHPNRANRGVLRSKIEAGEGTIPVANLDQGPQTWDAVMQGNALRTMSCSDKVCRWNVVGVQGALLSSLIEPIYYASVTLGSLHHPVHFERAVYGRIEMMAEQLQFPFKFNRPKLLMVPNGSKRQVKKSPNHAVLWSAKWAGPEIVAASKGKCIRPEVASRVAKRLQFIRFLRIYKNPDGRRENYVNLSYAEAKLLATHYQSALNQMKDCFKKANLGTWISKPVEQDSFCVIRQGFGIP